MIIIQLDAIMIRIVDAKKRGWMFRVRTIARPSAGASRYHIACCFVVV